MSWRGNPKYTELMCEKVIEHLSQGYSLRSFAGVIKVHHDTIYEWVNKYKEFEEAVSIGQSLGIHEMEKLSRLQYYGKKFKDFDPQRADARHLEFRMKNHKTKIYSPDVELTEGPQSITLNYNLDLPNGEEAKKNNNQ